MQSSALQPCSVHSWGVSLLVFLYVLQKGSPPPQMLFQQYPKTQWVMLGHRRQISFKHMPTLLRLMQNRQSFVTHPFCMTATCLSREEEVQLTDHRGCFGYLWPCTLDGLFHNCDTAARRMSFCRSMAKWLLIAVAIVKIVQTSRLPPGTLGWQPFPRVTNCPLSISVQHQNPLWFLFHSWANVVLSGACFFSAGYCWADPTRADDLAQQWCWFWGKGQTGKMETLV